MLTWLSFCLALHGPASMLIVVMHPKPAYLDTGQIRNTYFRNIYASERCRICFQMITFKSRNSHLPKENPDFWLASMLGKTWKRCLAAPFSSKNSLGFDWGCSYFSRGRLAMGPSKRR